jgi:hypothetical protein
MPTETPREYEGALRDALAQMRALILDGLRHGFFEYSVTCETVGNRRRQLIIRAGKSHKYHIAAEELQE